MKSVIQPSYVKLHFNKVYDLTQMRSVIFSLICDDLLNHFGPVRAHRHPSIEMHMSV